MSEHITNDVDVIAYLANVAKEADQHARDMRALADYNAAAGRREKDERVHADLALERARHEAATLTVRNEAQRVMIEQRDATIEALARDRAELDQYRELGATMRGDTALIGVRVDDRSMRAGIEVQSPHLVGWWRVNRILEAVGDADGNIVASRVELFRILPRHAGSPLPVLIRVDPSTIELHEAPF